MTEALRDYCDRLRNHVHSTESDREVVKISLHAIDAFERAVKSGFLEKTDLEEILLAAGNRRLGPFYIGMELMAHLFPDHPEIANAWRRLASSRLAHERWAAITALDRHQIPVEFVEELINQAINDKSSKVRLFAIDRVYSRKLHSLLPDLKKRLNIETNEKVIQELKWVMSMLDRGYYDNQGEIYIENTEFNGEFLATEHLLPKDQRPQSVDELQND